MKYPDTHDAAHREASSLLPWWVNGTLDDDEHAMMERHLAECPDCAREATQLRKMQDLIQSEPSNVPQAIALSRLQSRIQQAPTRRPNWWQHAMLSWRGASMWIRGALVLQTSLITCLLLLVLVRPHEVAPLYRTLSAAPAPAAPHAHITVIFNGAIPEQEVRALLLSLHASVVAGPTPEGAYVLALDPRQQDAALSRLRTQAHHAVVFAEPTPAPSPEDRMP